MFKREIKSAILTFLVLTVITGILYPLFVTGIAQLVFSKQANGSLVYRNGKPIGSSLIGQPFDDPKYFWGRVSAASPQYNASSSSGSNIGPANPVLISEVKGRIKALQTADPGNKASVPVDLVTSSASGLDPHISLAAANYQVARVARIRGLSQNSIQAIVKQHTYGRFLGLIGEPVVNVLEVNLALDGYKNH